MIRLIRFIIRFFRRTIWLTIWHSVYYFLKRPRRIVYLALLLMIGLVTIVTLDGRVDERILSAPLPPSDYAAGQVRDIPAMRGTITNGNSAFTKRLTSLMRDNDAQRYYAQFHHAMYSKDATYKWQVSTHFFGQFTLKPAYRAKSGKVCRSFEELISYGGQHQRFVGQSCKRDDGRSWCKLRPHSAQTCHIGAPSSFELFWRDLF